MKTILAILVLAAIPAHAEQFGLFAYRVTDGEVAITAYPDDATGDVEIPAQIDGLPVTSIDYSAFSGCTALTSVSIPDSVTDIGYGAFVDCSGLTSASIPDSVTYIGRLAFSGCTGLTSVSIPDSVTDIGYAAFEGCTGLTSVTISERINRIGPGVFSGCIALISISIPEGVTAIGENAFEGCIALISISIPEGLTSIGENAFEGCIALNSISIPVGVTSVGHKAFSGCTGLTSVSIPGSVTSIGYNTFYGCAGLTSIEVDALNPNYSSLEGVLFDKDKTRLIRFPARGSGEYAIPGSVTDIGGSAFEGCAGLTSVSIPGSVTSIGYNAFYGCTGLTSIEVDALNPNYSSLEGVLFDKDKTRLIRFPARGSGGYAIPGSVIDIGGSAFERCAGLTSITIPEGVTSIDDSAFTGCAGLRSIEVDALNPNYSSLDGVLFDKARTRLIRCPAGRSGDYRIPDSVASFSARACWRPDGGRGETICSGEGAFVGCINLLGVSIPAGVTSIGADTFRGCSNLRTVTIPAGVSSIGDERNWDPKELLGAFEDCTSLHSATFLGDAPTRFVPNTFTNAAPGFTVFYLSCSTGFTSPIWNGYPAVRIDEQACPAAAWLAGHNLSYDTNLQQDLNGDGVNLLMAYALNLDPNQNLSGSMPRPILGDDSLSISFFGAARGITYTVQATTDLKAWTTEGVTLSEVDTEGRQTATASLGGQQRFMRLVVRD